MTPSRADFAAWLLDVPLDRAVGIARFGLSLIAFIAVWVDRSISPSYTDQLLVVLGCYLLYSTGLMLAVAKGLTTTTWQHWAAYFIDVGALASLMYLSKGAGSPFFVLLTFVLLTATLRWNSQGAIAATVTLLVLLCLLAIGDWTLPDRPGPHAYRLILRGGYLVVIGAMLAYVGAFRERSRARFAKLAAWPANDPSADGSPPVHLGYAGKLLGAPRMLCTWDYADEPDRHFCLWADGECQKSREASDCPLAALATPVIATAIYVAQDGRYLIPDTPWGLKTCSSLILDSNLREKYHIRTAAIAPFSNATCSGYLFALDCHRSDDLLPLMTIIANRIGAESERDWLRRQNESAAVERERLRFARNIHDGVLQVLTATALNLKVCAENVDAKTRAEFDAIREVLANEQRRIRGLVENTRSKSAEDFVLAPLGRQLVSELGAYWHCEVALRMNPEDAEVSPEVAQSLYLMIAEAVANAAKHGHASRVDIDLECSAKKLDMNIQDNGSGFPGLTGTFADEALGVLKAGPRSLCERTKELGGALALSSSSTGAQLRIHLPLQ